MKIPDEVKSGLEYLSITDVAQKVEAAKRGLPYAYVEYIATDALAYIRELEAKVPKWISVKERLPEKKGKYIVCTAKGSVYCTKFSTNFHTDLYTHITHWMPLPEAPKEDV